MNKQAQNIWKDCSRTQGLKWRELHVQEAFVAGKGEQRVRVVCVDTGASHCSGSWVFTLYTVWIHWKLLGRELTWFYLKTNKPPAGKTKSNHIGYYTCDGRSKLEETDSIGGIAIIYLPERWLCLLHIKESAEERRRGDDKLKVCSGNGTKRTCW